MTIQRILPEYVETFTIETHPKRVFISSSTGGVTGSVYVFPRHSVLEKEVVPLAIYSSSFYQDTDLNSVLKLAKRMAVENNSNRDEILTYIDGVTSQSTSPRKFQQQEVLRFLPDVDITKNTLRKNTIINSTIPYYRNTYLECDFSYTNYHCLNFYTTPGSHLFPPNPTDSVLLYPASATVGPAGTLSSSYLFTDSFSFNFWINPKYTSFVANSDFNCGTILHLSSCYAVSLVTGSSKDINGFCDKYRILLQLSSSAEVPPSSIVTASLSGLTFLSADNSLTRNTWQNVTIRWGTSAYDLGSGSFIIDNEEKGTFVIPSSSITPLPFADGRSYPNVLCVGNFYEGTNTGADSLDYFFTTDTNIREGLTELVVDVGFSPTNYSFTQPLNAEIHDIKIYNKYLTDSEVETIRVGGPRDYTNLLFYLPPFFTRESPTRSWYGGFGGVFETPFFTFDGTTTQPFGAEMAFSVDGHYINLENFTREFVHGTYPRLWELTGSVINTPSYIPQSANEILYQTGSVIKRAYTVLPCDNGEFYPNFGLLEDLDTTSFVNDLEVQDLGNISLREVVSTTKYNQSIVNSGSTSLLKQLAGPDPAISSSLTERPGPIYTILQNTKDPSSNQVVFFDISNLFYGKQIKPETFVISDFDLSCSQERIQITLRDNGLGNLYRADSSGTLATWNSVGNIFYNEGVAVIKSPHLFFFGKEAFSSEFNGINNVHVLKINAVAKSYEVTSSSNPSYLPVSASDMANDEDTKFVYIDEVLLHDDNMNVIARTKIAQPVVKRTSDKITFNIKCDF